MSNYIFEALWTKISYKKKYFQITFTRRCIKTVLLDLLYDYHYINHINFLQLYCCSELGSCVEEFAVLVISRNRNNFKHPIFKKRRNVSSYIQITSSVTLVFVTFQHVLHKCLELFFDCLSPNQLTISSARFDDVEINYYPSVITFISIIALFL